MEERKRNEATSVGWLIIAIFIFALVALGYYVNPEAHSGLLLYVLFFEVFLGSLSFVGAVVCISKPRWLNFKTSLRKIVSKSARGGVKNF
jgi:hypothetical protein